MNLDGSWPYIIEIARSRLAHNKTEHHVSKYGDGIEVLGVAGEIAARRFLGLEEKVHTGFDDGADFEFFGRKVDVKATLLTPKVQFRYLQWPVWKRVKADVILMTAVDPIRHRAVVLGYALKSEVEVAPINSFRNTPCHEIPIPNLHPAWMLMTEWTKDFSDVGKPK